MIFFFVLDWNELVPGVIWIKRSPRIHTNMPQIPAKFFQSPYSTPPKITIEEVSVIWTAVIVFIIHLLFHVFR